MSYPHAAITTPACILPIPSSCATCFLNSFIGVASLRSHGRVCVSMKAFNFAWELSSAHSASISFMNTGRGSSSVSGLSSGDSVGASPSTNQRSCELNVPFMIFCFTVGSAMTSVSVLGFTEKVCEVCQTLARRM